MSEPTPISESQELRELEIATDSKLRREILSKLVKRLPAKALVTEPAVRRAVMSLGANTESGTPADRLQELSLIVQLASKAKEFRRFSEVPLKRLLALPPAALSVLEDQEARFQVASFLSQTRALWIADYLASETANRSTPIKLRSVTALGLFRNVQSWTEAIHELSLQLKLVFESPEADFSDLEFLLCSVFIAVRIAMEKAAIEPGSEFGKSLLEIVEFLARRPDRSGQDEKTGARLVVELAELVNRATSMRPILVTDKALLIAPMRVRQLIGKTTWPTPAKKPVGALMTRLCDAIAIGVRHGVIDKDLFASLEALAGSRDAAL